MVTSGAARRLIRRIVLLLIAAGVTYPMQQKYEQDGQIWLFIFELLIYAVILVMFLSQQTGRLKSGPDTSKVSLEELADEDPATGVYVALYLVFLMLIIVARVMLVGPLDDDSLGPWNLFIAFAPLLLIVAWRQYRLEVFRESQ